MRSAAIATISLLALTACGQADAPAGSTQAADGGQVARSLRGFARARSAQRQKP